MDTNDKKYIFVQLVPKEWIISLLDSICFIKNNSDLHKKIVIDKASYKKGILTGKIQEFIEKCKPYYHTSKRLFYLEKPIRYNSFITIIRQIIKSYDDIHIEKNVVYHKSERELTYTVSL